jgi:hypothetical protein
MLRGMIASLECVEVLIILVTELLSSVMIAYACMTEPECSVPRS